MLAPEHGRSIYGEPLRGLMLWDIYGREDAKGALKILEESFKKAMRVLSRVESSSNSD